mmetsp:Transcript_8254/g.24409  ORF Transcript_8254/g.24409 Transcript_8254/m.24409 type:complete len:303 (-) Transcript_8254:476-1384(-)
MIHLHFERRFDVDAVLTGRGFAIVIIVDTATSTAIATSIAAGTQADADADLALDRGSNSGPARLGKPVQIARPDRGPQQRGSVAPPVGRMESNDPDHVRHRIVDVELDDASQVALQQTRQDVRVGQRRHRRSQQIVLSCDESRLVGRPLFHRVQDADQALVGAAVVVELDGDAQEAGTAPVVAGQQRHDPFVAGLDVPHQELDGFVQVLPQEAGKVHVFVLVALLESDAAAQEHQLVGTDDKVKETDQAGLGGRRIRLDSQDAISQCFDAIELLGVIAFLVVLVVFFAAGRISHFCVCLFVC